MGNENRTKEIQFYFHPFSPILEIQMLIFMAFLLIIPHFYCDVLPILRLACGDTRTPEAVIFIVSVIVLTIPFSLISISYIFIVAAILKIRSAEGRRKAFSTCSSHLTTVILFYGSGFLSYLLPASGSPLEMVFSLQYSVVTPMLNPLIYSLQNKEVKAAMRRMLRRYVNIFT